MGSSGSSTPNLHLRFFLLFSATLLVQRSSQSSKPDALFIFGDSLYDTGNNKYMENCSHFADVWPYGETYFKHPTGRACDGRLIPDFIAEYVKLPSIPPYLEPFESEVGDDAFVGTHLELAISIKLQSSLRVNAYSFIYGANFASGGAGALVETHRGRTINLQTQLSYFKNVEKLLRRDLGGAEAKKLLGRAVYMFSIGGNDYFVASKSEVVNSREEYVGMVIGNLTTVIKEIHKRGGRKFGMSTMIPQGCLPYFRAVKHASTGGSGCLDEATLFTELHNRVLTKALVELEQQLEGFRYSIFDACTAGMERINNPSKYGFKNVEAACCGGSGPYGRSVICGEEGYHLCRNASEYFFFDNIHPSEMANHQFAALMWSGGPDIVKPYHLKTLFEQ